MRAVIQRVTSASVTIDGDKVSEIGEGLLVLLGVRKGDTREDADYISRKIEGLRVFPDTDGVMNLPLGDKEILLVSQFTLYGDARRGNRPSYSLAEGEGANELYQYTAMRLRQSGKKVKTGVFGADMQVALVNDGPVTILLESSKEF